LPVIPPYYLNPRGASVKQNTCLSSSGEKEVLNLISVKNSHTKSMAGKEIVYTFGIYKKHILYKTLYS